MHASPSILRHLGSAVALCLLAACGSADFATKETAGGDDEMASDGDAATTTGTALDTGTDSDAPTRVPVYYALNGELTITEDLAEDPGASFVTLSLFDDDEVKMCDVEYIPMAIEALDSDDETIALYGWWEFALVEPTTDCLEATYADKASLRVGLGAYDPLLDPAVDAHDLDGAHLYGLYIQEAPGDPTWVFGVGGTEAHFVGEEVPVEEAPLPEGVYTLRGLHLLPIGE